MATGDLFSQADNEAQHLTLPDAELMLIPRAGLSLDSSLLMRTLLRDTDWREQDITVYGKTYKQPRLFAWHGDEHCRYSYSGITLTPSAWTATLAEIKPQIEQLCDAQFNCVMLNLYRDHNDSMGMHADDEPELGPEPAIASLSLGDCRIFKLRHKTRNDLGTVKLELQDGSLLLMRGPTQRHWKHGIAKQGHACGPRINLTFRYIAKT